MGAAAAVRLENEVREKSCELGVDPVRDCDAVRLLVDEAVAAFLERALVGAVAPLENVQATARALTDVVAGLGPLQRHLDDPEIQEVCTNEPSSVNEGSVHAVPIRTPSPVRSVLPLGPAHACPFGRASVCGGVYPSVRGDVHVRDGVHALKFSSRAENDGANPQARSMTMTVRARTLFTAAACVPLLTMTAVTASAQEQTAVDEVAQVIAEADPDGVEVIAPDAITRDAATFTAESQEGEDFAVLVPFDATLPVVVEVGTGNPVELSLPDEVDVNDARVAEDGTVVYTGDGADVHAAVQALEDGVRMQTVIESPDAPMVYTYDLGDDIPVVLDDGSVDITQITPEGVIAVVATIEVPWAIDANGVEVETWYTVDGNTLTQHISPSADAAYPITADPRLSYGVGVYINMYGWEIRAVASAIVAAGGSGAVAICSGATKLPHAIAKVAAVACTAVGAPTLKVIFNQIVSIWQTGNLNNGSCYQARIIGVKSGFKKVNPWGNCLPG